ncbi:MAG: tetratricopeptide repeat protein [Proteobacteria bacterium]|nr:tetratricopeptide repeat protein [Pseudomonadota bacterium]
MGRAFRLDGRYEEAIAPLNRALERDPNFLHPHAVLAVIYSELGREQDARAKAADILEIDPGFTIREFSKALPYKHELLSKVVYGLIMRRRDPGVLHLRI